MIIPPQRQGKEKALIELFKAALQAGKNAVMVVPTAEARARMVWLSGIPKERVICPKKPESIGPEEPCFPILMVASVPQFLAGL